MNELAPEHPVQGFRFVTRRSPAPPAEPPAQEDKPPSANMSRRDGTIDRADLEAARKVAETVGDERLRRSILAALDAGATRPPCGPPSGPPVNPKK
jgi:hypothetical protein